MDTIVVTSVIEHALIKYVAGMARV